MKGFSLFGVPVRLHFTFILLVIFLVVTDLGARQTSSRYAVFLVGLFASVLLHEMAHAFVGMRFGVRTTEIVMFPIGGLSRMARMLKPSEELWIAGAGPMVNILLSAGIFVYMFYMRQAVPINVADLLQPTDANALARLAYGNLLLAGFNLLPAFPMDGGRILRALLCFIRPEDQATRTAAWMGRMLAISMGLYGLLAPQFMLVFFAFFIYLGAAQESAAAMGRTLYARNSRPRGDDHRVPHAGTRPHHSRCRESAAVHLATGFSGDSRRPSGRAAGAQSAAEGARFGGPGRLRRGRDGSRIPLGSSLLPTLPEVLPLMAQAGRCALVMDRTNLLGLLTTDNLSEFLLLRRFGMEPVV